jgi:hypothetical protein
MDQIVKMSKPTLADGRVFGYSSFQASYGCVLCRMFGGLDLRMTAVPGFSKALTVVIPKRIGVMDPPELFCRHYSGIGVMVLGYPDTVVINDQ